MKRFEKFMTRGAVLFASAVVLAMGGAGCSKQAENGPAAAPESGAYFKTHFQTEAQFVVESIVTDIAEMCVFAKTRTPPEAGKVSVDAQETADSQFDFPKYEINITMPKGHVKTTLAVRGPIWSAAVYTNITQLLLKELGVSTAKATETGDTAMLKALLDLTGKNIEAQNKSLSDALGRDPMNPGLHEKAAALMGAFTLREYSGDFFDIRSELNRITAHLAMACALRNGAPPGVNATVAETIVETMVNDQKSALANAASLDKNIPELAAWSRVLHAHITHDYRELEKIKVRSTLEDIEYFRSYGFCVDLAQAWEKISDAQKLALPDLCRFALSDQPSVSMGHVMAELSLPLEMKELREVYEATHGVLSAKQPDLATLLNQVPERGFAMDGKGYLRFAVIGWGHWGAFLQRHICHSVEMNYDFMEHRWGVPEEAGKFSDKCDKAFSELRLYPFVRRFNCANERSYHAAVDGGFKVTRETPHLTPAMCWNYLCYKVDFAPAYNPNPNPHVNEWHSHNPLPGTAYDIEPRFNHPSLTDRPDFLARLEKEHEMAPYNENIARNLLYTKYKDNPPAAVEEAVFKPMLEYNSFSMARLANLLTNDPAAFEALMKKSAELRPNGYSALGSYFADRHEDKKAAEYFQKAIDLSMDAVSSASDGPWLVKYYLKTGQTNKAAKVADFAAEVYSYDGLLAKAGFLETTGDYAGAMDYYKKIEERYRMQGDLILFCQRYKAKTGRTDYDETLNRRVRGLFPKGIEMVSLKDFNGRPTDGVSLDQVNNQTASAGLNLNDIIVAIQGIRVHNFDQYTYARASKPGDQMTLIIWRRDGYHQLSASPPQHKFGAAMTSYEEK